MLPQNGPQMDWPLHYHRYLIWRHLPHPQSLLFFLFSPRPCAIPQTLRQYSSSQNTSRNFPKRQNTSLPKRPRIGRYFKLTESNQTYLLHLTFYINSHDDFQAEAIWFAPISSCSVMTRTNGKLVALLPFAATWIWSSLPRTQSDSAFLTSCTCLFFSLRFSYQESS